MRGRISSYDNKKGVINYNNEKEYIFEYFHVVQKDRNLIKVGDIVEFTKNLDRKSIIPYAKNIKLINEAVSLTPVIETNRNTAVTSVPKKEISKNEVVVRTRSELEAAKNKGVERIIIKGDLAEKIYKTRGFAKVGAGTIATLGGLLGVATLAAPVTGGISFAVAAPIAALTGLEIAAIIIASSVGISLISAVWMGYEDISFKRGDQELIIRKKS